MCSSGALARRLNSFTAQSYSSKKKHDQKPIDDWIAKAIWPRSNLSHHIANGIDNNKRKKAVFEFVQGYYSEHNRLQLGYIYLVKISQSNFLNNKTFGSYKSRSWCLTWLKT